MKPTLKLRPACVHCGKRYGQRSTKELSVYVPKGAPTPEIPTNQHVVKVVRHSYGVDTAGKAIERVRFDLWDGETISASYRPFCTATCAWHFARKAYERGFRA